MAELRAAGVPAADIATIEYDDEEEHGPTRGAALRACFAPSWRDTRASSIVIKRRNDMLIFNHSDDLTTSVGSSENYTFFNYATHAAAAAEVLRQGLAFALVLEDDAEVSPKVTGLFEKFNTTVARAVAAAVRPDSAMVMAGGCWEAHPHEKKTLKVCYAGCC